MNIEGFHPLDISIAVPGLPFDGNTATKKSLGGSETAGYYMARELARMGHHVRLFCNCDQADCKPGNYDGVQYFPLSDWSSFVHFVPHDLAIVQRAPNMFSQPTMAKVNWLWCHDLALGRSKNEVMGVMWNIDKVIVLSEYMRDQYKSVYSPLPEEALMLSRNGIDLSLFQGLGNIKRHRNRIVYTARPERGLDNLLRDVFPKLLDKNPTIELHLAGYLNPVQHLMEFYNQIDMLIRGYGERVVWHGALNKRQLAELYASCGVYTYPTPSKVNAPFAEISCITAMEAQACGLPIVTTDRGALAETIGKGAGRLVSGDPWKDEYVEAFVNEVLDLITNEDKWNQASEAGIAASKNFSWSGVAEQWTVEALGYLREKSTNYDTLVRHFWRQSDIMAAREIIKQHPDKVGEPLKARIAKEFAFIDEPSTKEQYEKIASTHGPNIGHEINEPRFQILMKRMLENPQCTRIIDWGCAYGNYLLNLVPRLPDKREWLGISIAQGDIDLANKHKEKMLNDEQKERVRFKTVGDVDKIHSQFGNGEKANGLVLYEVLEHVADPTALVDQIEQYVEPGGRIFITVPYGPWEYDSYYDYPYRAHLWEFDWHDLRDIFAGKKDVQIAPFFYGVSSTTGSPLGWWIVEYVHDPKRKTGSINIDRKISMQNPRMTMSAFMMCGPNAEENLHWCLRSFHHVVDELVIVDCGMSEEGRRIAIEESKWYEGDCKFIIGPDPKVEGFETPRNIGLKECTSDFVLWIDSDEKLLNPQGLHKYMRDSMFNGYCLKQIHFAADTTFEPDTPVRIFRNPKKCERTQTMRFFGMIHEHPELQMNEGPGSVITLSDVQIPHLGYLNETARRGRFARNLPMLEKDIKTYPERILQKHFIIRDKMLLCMHELQSNGGVITDEIRQRAQEVIDLYRKHFRNNTPYGNIDTLQYYSQACQVLGLGATVAWQVAASRDEMPKINGTQFVRFASMEDAENELVKQMRNAMQPFMEEHY